MSVLPEFPPFSVVNLREDSQKRLVVNNVLESYEVFVFCPL